MNRYKRARTLPQLVRAYGSVLGVPEQPEGERAPGTVAWLLSIVVGALVAIPATVLLYSPIELVAAPESLVAMMWALVAFLLVCKFVAFPLADRVAGVTRLRGVPMR